MNFHDIRLPKFIEVFAVGNPAFMTSCVRTRSGREVRSLNQEYANQRYFIKNCRLSTLEFEEFNSFFRGRRASYYAFRFRDYADHSASKQFIAKGDGVLQEFQLTKLYDDPILPYFRPITKPVPGSVSFYINNTKVVTEVDYNTGKVALAEPLPQDNILTTDYIFDVAVRFGKDSFEYAYGSDGAIELSEIELLEVI